MVAVASLLVLLRWCLLSGAAPKAVVSADRLLEADLSIIVSLLRLVGPLGSGLLVAGVMAHAGNSLNAAHILLKA